MLTFLERLASGFWGIIQRIITLLVPFVSQRNLFRGWLLLPFLQKIGAADGARLRQRVVAELKTTFASHYTQVVSLQEALQLSSIAIYNKRATGEKFLINPNKGG